MLNHIESSYLQISYYRNGYWLKDTREYDVNMTENELRKLIKKGCHIYGANSAVVHTELGVWGYQLKGSRLYLFL